jgi:VQ motif
MFRIHLVYNFMFLARHESSKFIVHLCPPRPGPPAIKTQGTPLTDFNPRSLSPQFVFFELFLSFSMENKRSINTVPKVRIIHIIAPDIIKTDVSNFRDLVQRLTGKPTEPVGGASKKRKAQCIDTIYTPEKKPKIEEQAIKLEEVEDGKVWFETDSLRNGYLKSLEEEVGFFFSYECDWYEGVLGVV